MLRDGRNLTFCFRRASASRDASEETFKAALHNEEGGGKANSNSNQTWGGIGKRRKHRKNRDMQSMRQWSGVKRISEKIACTLIKVVEEETTLQPQISLYTTTDTHLQLARDIGAIIQFPGGINIYCTNPLTDQCVKQLRIAAGQLHALVQSCSSKNKTGRIHRAFKTPAALSRSTMSRVWWNMMCDDGKIDEGDKRENFEKKGKTKCSLRKEFFHCNEFVRHKVILQFFSQWKVSISGVNRRDYSSRRKDSERDKECIASTHCLRSNITKSPKESTGIKSNVICWWSKCISVYQN